MACNPLIVVSGMAFEAKIAQDAGIRAIYGLNPEKLMADMEAAIRQGAAGLLSFGTCAGLSPALLPGTVVIARQVRSQGKAWDTDAAWTARLAAQLPDAVCADIVGVDRPLASVEEKARLHAQSGAVAADMESHLVARIAQQYNVSDLDLRRPCNPLPLKGGGSGWGSPSKLYIVAGNPHLASPFQGEELRGLRKSKSEPSDNLPFAVLRVVLDGAECALPPAALASTYADGSINYIGLTRSLLAHPGQLPALLRLGADHRAAKKTLLRAGGLLRSGFFGMDIG